MAQRQLGIELVSIAPTLFGSVQVAGADEVSDDSLRRALGDPDPLGYVPVPDARILSDTEHDVRVIREERPVGRHGAQSKAAVRERRTSFRVIGQTQPKP